jgi:DNA primase
MIDLNSVKTSTDLLSIAGQNTYLRKVASSGGGEFAGACPMCGGKDRFRVQNHQHRWLCRNCTDGKWRDAIDFIAMRDHLDTHRASDLKEICRRATNGILPLTASRTYYPVPKTEPTLPPSKEWQAMAHTFIQKSVKALWASEGKQALAYLHNRGLSDQTIMNWNIGFNHNEYFEPLDQWGLENPGDGLRHTVWLPKGIIIPCIIEGIIWYTKIRRFEDTPKYINIRGGKPALFGADGLKHVPLIFLTEGEFDCLLAWQELGDLVGTGTLGSATNSLDLVKWGKYMDTGSPILAALDSDKAGQNALEKMVAASNKIHPLQVPSLQPGDKDISDFYLAGGNLREWLENELERIFPQVRPELFSWEMEEGIGETSELYW